MSEHMLNVDIGASPKSVPQAAKRNATTKASHFVGIGAAGGNYLQYIYSKHIEARYTYVDNHFEQVELFDNVHFKEYNPETDAQHAAWLPSYFKQNETIVLLAGLGGVTGSSAAQSMLTQLEKAGFEVFLVGTTPFKHETDRIELTEELLKVLGHQSNVGIIANEDAQIKYGHLKHTVAFAAIDDEVYRKAMQLIGE